MEGRQGGMLRDDYRRERGEVCGWEGRKMGRGEGERKITVEERKGKENEKGREKKK